MKRSLVLIVLLAILVQPGFAYTQAVPSQELVDGPVVTGVSGELASTVAEVATLQNGPQPGRGGMPPRPVPAKAIPYHEAGKPSNAGSYVTEVNRLNDEGLRETVQISGLEAMVADGLDPLAGNHTLVNWDKLLFSAYQNQHSFDLRTLGFYTPTLQVEADSYLPLGNYQSNDVAGGDLNGDGQAEQIAAWIGGGNHLYLSIGEMPGSQVATSAPAVVARGAGSPSGYALAFDGVDDYVQVDAGIDLAGDSFTVAFWARRDSTDAAHIVVAQGWNAQNMALHIGFRANNAFTCAFQSNDLDTPAYTDTGWHHWACTYDAGSSTRTIYRDGVMVARDTGVAAYGGSGVLNIGRLGIWDTSPFDGLIDEVGIWDVARTQEQIEADLSRMAPDGTGLLAYWPFDEGTGPEAGDISGNGHTGTLYGPAWTPEDAPLADLHLVVRGYDEALWHCSYDVDSGDCLGWSNAGGGILASAPAIVSRGPDQFDLFALGVDNLVYQRHWDLDGWSADWVQESPDPSLQVFASSTRALSMPEWSAPAAVARGGDQLDLFRLAPDNTLRWRQSDDGVSWGAWQNLGGMLASGPGVVSPGAGQMHVFGRGADDALWTRTYDGGWGAWARVPLDGMDAGVTIASAPTPVSPAAGEIVVYVRGSDGQLWSVTYAGSSWGTWSAGGGALASGVGAALWDGDGQLFGLLDDGRLQHSDDDGDTWTPLRRLEAQLVYDTGSVAAAPYDPTALENLDVDVETGRFLGNGRDQIVVAHRDTDWNTYKLQLYDIGPGFEPVLVAEGSVTTSSYGYFSAARIATGDLNGDGLDEIAVIKLLTDTRWWQIEVYDADSEAGTIEFLAGTDGKYGNADFAGTMNIAAGDFDGDGLDEIAASSDWCDRWVHDGTYYYDYYVNFTIVDDYNENLAVKYFRDRDLVGDSLTASTELSTYATGLVLAAGDVDGDGRDEIVRTIAYDNDYFHSHIWPNLYRHLEVLDAGDLANPQVGASVHLGVYSWESWLERLAVGDLDRDLVDEIAFFKVAGDIGHTEGTLQVHVYEYLPPTAPEDPGSLLLIDSAYPDPISFDWLRSPNLVAADYTGDGLRVGPPSYRVQTQMTTPEVFLNLPPMHRDILSGVGEITIGDGAEATHYAAHSEEEESTTQSNRDWSLSTGLETSAGGGGHKVTASLENTYGQNFSKTETDISGIKFEDTTTAAYYDQVIYNGTNYAIWEYPVLGIPADGEDGAPTISVIFPLVETTSQPVTRQGRLCDENFYVPGHQTYNVWSYDPLGTAEDFDDYDLLLSSKDTTGGTEFSMSMSDISQEALSNSFHNQISAGLEYSYESELKVPLIGKAWDVSFRAYANGSYGSEKISTLSTSFAEESAVGLDIPGDSSLYVTKAYLYWAKAGYLVVDYQTDPDPDSGSWDYYDKPDPAFILPWYGFPDPVTGLFPSPPDPDAPPCGLDRQLFTHDIDLDPAYVENGDTVTLRATVRNFSDEVPTATVTVRFYRGDPAAGSIIGSCTIAGSNLDRDLGPQTCSTTWVVSDGAGEERVYAVIDPLNAFDEMHDGDDVIDNNVGYGLLYVANADYFDPGLRQAQAYQAILYEDAPGLGFGLYLPTTNISETVRYELVPTLMGELSIVGKPVEVLAFRGGEDEPENGHSFEPTPAGMMAWYRNGDLLPGMDEADLNLFRLDGAVWVPAACPGYEVIRFAEDNRIAVPICETGVFVLSDGDLTQEVFLPLILR